MGDIELTSAANELKEHQRQLDPDGWEVGVSRQALDIVLEALARSDLEARKAEESMAARDVLAERKRQVDVEHWMPGHDDQHTGGELAQAAGVYALAAGSHDYRWVLKGLPVNDYLAAAMKLWPWDKSWFKPKDRRRDLVKAAALLIAEIERLDRALPLTEGGDKP